MQKPLLVSKGVIMLDMCSSTRILEDLHQTGNLEVWQCMLTNFKHYLDTQHTCRPFVWLQPYKFMGDGWIVLFDLHVRRSDLMQCIREIGDFYQVEYEANLKNCIQYESEIALTYGISSGDLLQIEMDGRFEYIGRPLNIASRLQSAAKSLPGKPQGRAIISNHCFNTLPHDFGEDASKAGAAEVTVDLRNLGGPSKCFEIYP